VSQRKGENHAKITPLEVLLGRGQEDKEEASIYGPKDRSQGEGKKAGHSSSRTGRKEMGGMTMLTPPTTYSGEKE